MVRCEELSSPKDGVKIGNETVVESQVFFNCSRCYQLKGASNLTCLQDGQWNGQQPTCERKCILFVLQGNHCDIAVWHCAVTGISSLISVSVVRCPGLPSPLNGRKYGDSNSCDSETRFTCDKRYNLIGSKVRVCRQNGNWSDEQPFCKGKMRMSP